MCSSFEGRRPAGRCRVRLSLAPSVADPAIPGRAGRVEPRGSGGRHQVHVPHRHLCQTRTALVQDGLGRTILATYDRQSYTARKSPESRENHPRRAWILRAVRMTLVSVKKRTPSIRPPGVVSPRRTSTLPIGYSRTTTDRCRSTWRRAVRLSGKTRGRPTTWGSHPKRSRAIPGASRTFTSCWRSVASTEEISVARSRGASVIPGAS